MFKKLRLFAQLSLCVSLCFSATATGQLIKSPSSSNKNDPTQKAFVPAPRELSRPIKRAKDAIAKKEYAEAAAYLGEVLAVAGAQDYLGYLDGDSGRAVSLRREAQRLLGSIPHKFRESYELRYGTESKQLLNEAIQQSDYSKMADIVQRYFHTPAGYMATMLLGHHHLQQGRPIAAAFAFQRIVDDEQARKKHDPEASVLMAMCWVLGRDNKRAINVLNELKKNQRSATIRFGGNQIDMFQVGQDPLDWLARLIGNSPLAELQSVEQWIMYRGNPQRNASSGTGFPLRYPRWRVPTVNDPDKEKIIQSIHSELIQNDASSIPMLQPIAVGDTLLFRSDNKLVGVDFRTGKRTWVFPDDMPFEDNGEKFGSPSIAKQKLKNRIWMDALYGQVSSDGKNVFLIDRKIIPVSNNRNGFVISRRGQEDSLANILRAADIGREGAFKWEVGGETGLDEPKLANTFFLGAPLPLDGRLYCICETQGEVRLVVLNSDTGKFIWGQQLATSEQVGAIASNRWRQLMSATPSYSNGILVCPTTANAIVAVDLTTKSLVWGFEYVNKFPQRRNYYTPQPPIALNTTWIDETVTISNGVVVLASIQSDHLYCLDLTTGKSKWTERGKVKSFARGDAAYVATVDNENIYLVGQKNVKAVSLKTGKQAWRTSLDKAGRASGRGYFNDGFYFLPTTESQLVKIKLSDGSIVEKRPTVRVLGNLICYQGDVISHGVDMISVFPQVQPNRKRLESIVTDGQQLTEQQQLLRAQLLAHDKQFDEAVKIAEQAYKKSPSGARERMLMDLIIDYMKNDFVAASATAEKYDRQLRQRSIANYQTARVDGLIKVKKFSEALEEIFDLAKRTPDLEKMPTSRNEVLAISRRSLLNQRFDLWFKSQIYKVLNSSTDQQRETLLTSIREYAKQRIESVPQGQFVKFTRMLGSEFLSQNELLVYAKKHLELKQYLACEFAIESLARSSDENIRAQAEGIYTQLASRTLEQQFALSWFEKLARDYGDAVCYQGKTGKQLLSEFKKTLKPSSAATPWHIGRAKYNWSNNNVRLSYNDRESPMNCIQSDGRYSDKYKFSFVAYRKMVNITDNTGKTVAKVTMAPIQTRQYTSNVAANYLIRNHLLVVVFGYDIAAFDLHRISEGDKARLWHISTKPSNTPASSYALYFRNETNSDRTWGNISTRFISNQKSEQIGCTSNIHSNGFCYLHKNQLICIDPLTGTQRWKTSHFPPDCSISIGDDSVAVVERKTRKVHVLKLRDGSAILETDLDKKIGKYWAGTDASGIYTVVDSDAKTQSLVRYDYQNKKEIWRKTYPRKSHANTLNNQWVTVVDPTGKFEMFDIRTGKTTVTSQLGKFKSKGYGVEVFPHGDFLRVAVRSDRTPTSYKSEKTVYFQGINYSIVLFSGAMQMIDRKSGKTIWPKPVEVESFSILKNQPTDLPILILARLVMVRSTNGRISSSGRQMQIAGIDTRTGRELFLASDRQPSMQHFAIKKAPDKQELVVATDRKKLTVQIEQAELPPAPVARFDYHRTVETVFPKPKPKPSTKKTNNKAGKAKVGAGQKIKLGNILKNAQNALKRAENKTEKKSAQKQAKPSRTKTKDNSPKKLKSGKSSPTKKSKSAPKNQNK